MLSVFPKPHNNYLPTFLFTPWYRTFFEKLIVTQLVKEQLAFFMEQKPVTGPNPEPAKSSLPHQSLPP
jgi:hypothetical protein